MSVTHLHDRALGNGRNDGTLVVWFFAREKNWSGDDSHEAGVLRCHDHEARESTAAVVSKRLLGFSYSFVACMIVEDRSFLFCLFARISPGRVDIETLVLSLFLSSCLFHSDKSQSQR